MSKFFEKFNEETIKNKFKNLNLSYNLFLIFIGLLFLILANDLIGGNLIKGGIIKFFKDLFYIFKFPSGISNTIEHLKEIVLGLSYFFFPIYYTRISFKFSDEKNFSYIIYIFVYFTIFLFLDYWITEIVTGYEIEIYNLPLEQIIYMFFILTSIFLNNFIFKKSKYLILFHLILFIEVVLWSPIKTSIFISFLFSFTLVYLFTLPIYNKSGEKKQFLIQLFTIILFYFNIQLI